MTLIIYTRQLCQKRFYLNRHFCWLCRLLSTGKTRNWFGLHLFVVVSRKKSRFNRFFLRYSTSMNHDVSMLDHQDVLSIVKCCSGLFGNRFGSLLMWWSEFLMWIRSLTNRHSFHCIDILISSPPPSFPLFYFPLEGLNGVVAFTVNG